MVPVTSSDADPAPSVEPGSGPGVARRSVDWLFVDRRRGGYTVAQWPNIPLWLFIASTVGLRIAGPTGTVATSLRVVADSSLLAWALDEVVRGVNPFRRLLGLAVLGLTVVGLVRTGW
jgi:hypothetical protein